MPSSALEKFERYMLKDVHNLIRAHSQLNHEGLGRRGLGHITRSGILMLCASWELYLEELIIESVKYLNSKHSLPSDLPKQVQKTLAEFTKAHKHDLKVLELAGDGWKRCLEDHARTLVNSLNTPKKDPVNILYRKFLGVEELSASWSYQQIDDFVSARGDIAHKGSQANYVTINNLRSYLEEICKTVIETDNYVAEHLKIITLGRTMPWRRRTI